MMIIAAAAAAAGKLQAVIAYMDSGFQNSPSSMANLLLK